MSLQGPRLRGSFEALGSSVTARAVLAVLAAAALVVASLNVTGNLTVGGTSTLGSVSASSVDVSGDASASGYLWTGTGVKFDFVGGSGPELFKHASCSSVSAPPGSVCMRTGAGSGAVFVNTSATDPGAVWTELGGGSSSFSGVSLYHSTTQTATSTVALLLVYDTEAFDVGGYHSTSSQTSRSVAPVTGYYYVRAGGTFAASSNGYRELSVHKNSNGTYNAANIVLVDIKAPNAASNTAWMNANGIVSLTAGDYLEVFALHDAGVNLTITRASYVPFQMELVGL